MPASRSVPEYSNSNKPVRDGLGLSTGHISGKVAASASYAEGGVLSHVAFSGKRRGEYYPGRTRSAVSDFSRKSRRRLLNKLASINRADAGLPLFIHLTYPDAFPMAPDVWKRDIERWYERLVYQYGPFALIWRLELKVRKSGEVNAGRLAPHFHALAFLKRHPSEMYESVSRHWYEACGQLDPKHLKAGTKVHYANSWNGVMNYASKYVAKDERLAIPADGVEYAAFPGRHWGVMGRKYLPVLIREFSVAVAHGVRMKRHLRKYAGLPHGDKYTSLYCYVPDEVMLQLLRMYGYVVDGRGPPDRSLHEKINARVAV